MIDINLVPLPLRKKSSVGVLAFLPLDMPANVLMGAGTGLLLVVLTHLLLLLMLGFNGIVLAAHKIASQRVLPDKKIIDSLGDHVQDLNKKQKEITGITAGIAKDWSRKFNAIANGLPQGMWLRKIMVDSAGVSIEGSVISQKQNEVATVSSFVNSLKSDPTFMRDFDGLEVDSIQKMRRGPTEIADFKLTAKFKSVPKPAPVKK